MPTSGSDDRGRSRMIALGRSPIAGPSSPYPATPAGVVAAVPRGRGRTSGVPVSGSEMTWTARPKTSSTIRIGTGTILGGPSRACSGRNGGARGVLFRWCDGWWIRARSGGADPSEVDAAATASQGVSLRWQMAISDGRFGGGRLQFGAIGLSQA